MLSPYLIAALLGWIIAQGSKYIFALIRVDLYVNFKAYIFQGECQALIVPLLQL